MGLWGLCVYRGGRRGWNLKGGRWMGCTHRETERDNANTIADFHQATIPFFFLYFYFFHYIETLYKDIYVAPSDSSIHTYIHLSISLKLPSAYVCYPTQPHFPLLTLLAPFFLSSLSLSWSRSFFPTLKK